MRIGIPGSETDGVFGVHTNYLYWIEQVGTPVIVTPSLEEPLKFLYGIVLPGGADIYPGKYGQWPEYRTSKPNTYLEYFDDHVLPLFVEAKLPIFGICRGLQALNVFFGGTLRQDLVDHPYSQHETDLVHRVTTRDRSVFRTNSFHHQGIARLGNGVRVEANSEESGLVEAISVDANIFAVQWHPERMWDAYSIKKFTTLFS
jgi:putative glutamine amidotransferase